MKLFYRRYTQVPTCHVGHKLLKLLLGLPEITCRDSGIDNEVGLCGCPLRTGVFYYAPNFEKAGGAYCFWLVRA